jgi:hypothetical protein
VRVLNNGQTVPASDVQISGNNITVSGALSDGSNKLIVWATDTSGNALSAQSTLWAGSATLNVTVSGQGASNPTVSAHLGDAPSVMEQQTASNGQATFSNVPARTVLLTAVTSDNKFATAATTGNAGTASLTLVGFNAPSTTINNDFSQGTTAWTPSLPSVISLIAHVENVGGTAKARQSTSKVVDREAMRVKRALDRARGAGIKLQQRANAPTNSTDEDLSLTTSGEGPQTVSYTFAVDPGTSSVTVRYRFVTAEVPGGYFGSQYDDGYSVSARSLSQGSQASDVNSMNALGLAAFDANGSTAWKTLTLSVNSAGDTVQVDASVTNVGDGLYDSQIIIDYVAEQPLTVTVDMPNACPSQTVTFSAQGSSVDSATWSGGGTPASGTGSSFPTHFASTGDYTAQASAGGQSGTATVHVSEASGPAWVSRFPTSTSVTDLVNPFQTAVTNFIAALTAAGAPPSISATLRPPERAYLMHYAYAVAKQGLDPSSVPPMDGVDICWEHYDASGNKDSAGSVAAAAQMVAAYGIAYPPALSSRHTEGLAIDMSISWSGDLTINQADGTSVTITSTPRTGAGNSDLWAVGASYGVLKLQSDPPHWSDDGH